MASQAVPDGGNSSATTVAADYTPPRVWPGVVIVAGYWSLIVYLMTSDNVISTSFMITAGACLLMTVAFLIWWLAASRMPWTDRLSGRGRGHCRRSVCRDRFAANDECHGRDFLRHAP